MQSFLLASNWEKMWIPEQLEVFYNDGWLENNLDPLCLAPLLSRPRSALELSSSYEWRSFMWFYAIQDVLCPVQVQFISNTFSHINILKCQFFLFEISGAWRGKPSSIHIILWLCRRNVLICRAELVPTTRNGDLLTFLFFNYGVFSISVSQCLQPASSQH